MPTALVRDLFAAGSEAEKQGRYPEARQHLAAALALDASIAAPVHAQLARMLWLENRWPEALQATTGALADDPTNFLALVIAGRCSSALGLMHDACEFNRRAMEVQTHPEFHSHLVFEMNFLEGIPPETIAAEARRWNRLYAAPLAPRIRPHANNPDPGRRLKVGYVSPDFRQHALMHFLPPVIERHDRAQFEIYIYATGIHSDSRTARLEAAADRFYATRDPEQLDGRVRADSVDILVDLAGHTMGPAYPAFALKPAPVQVSWQGVLASTGLDTMDYFIGDAVMPAAGSEHLFSETVYRLPRAFCCYRPFADIPASAAPCRAGAPVTFGCFNNPQKMGRDVVRLWAAILHSCPGSRLLLKYAHLENPAVNGHLRAWFGEAGIAADRVLFEAASAPAEYLSSYRRVDVALDPFPYNGLTITLDALWMGVPVVTLAGRSPVQRAASSVLTAAGLTAWIADTPERYLHLALATAELSRRQPELRGKIRAALRASALMDEAGLVRALEGAYREMWRTWCCKNGPCVS